MPQAADIDWSQLEQVERLVLDEVTPRLEAGYDVKQIAAELGLDAKELQAAVDRLAARLMALSGSIELPELSEEEFETLKASIREHGQRVPILRGSPGSGSPGKIVDGIHRRRACAQLRLEPRYLDVDGSAEELESLGLVLNVARRHLSTSSRRGIARAKLLADPSLSDRQIAIAVGVSHPTVATVRRELEASGDVERLSTRTDAAGRKQPTRARADAPPAEHRSIRVLIPRELYEQYLDGWVSCTAFRLLERRAGVHELQVQLLDPTPATDEQTATIGRYIDELATKLDRNRDRVVDELLRTASDVFAREISTIADLYVDEAAWLTSRISVLTQEETPA